MCPQLGTVAIWLSIVLVTEVNGSIQKKIKEECNLSRGYNLLHGGVAHIVE